MEHEPGNGRRYRPLHRTPPEYQTVIKFLLMASILDSVWVAGPPRLGSACGLVRSSIGQDAVDVLDHGQDCLVQGGALSLSGAPPGGGNPDIGWPPRCGGADRGPAVASECPGSGSALGSKTGCVDVQAGPSKPSDFHAYEYENLEVPCVMQLFYIVTVVLVVIGMPCCPAVLENACALLR